MGLTLEVFTATVCVLGLVGFVWWLLGRLVHPLSGNSGIVLLRGRGDGAGLEQAIRGFLWLRGLGLLNVPILIADVDLTPQGYDLALRLAARWPGIILWPMEDLREYLTHMK